MDVFGHMDNLKKKFQAILEIFDDASRAVNIIDHQNFNLFDVR